MESPSPERSSVVSEQLLRNAETIAAEYIEQNPINTKTLFEVFGKEQVLNDFRWAAHQMQEHQANEANDPRRREQKRISNVFETFYLREAVNGHWFGSGETRRTTKYDDFKNHIDMYTIMTRESGHSNLALSTDLTFSPGRSLEKLERIVRDIDQGRLGLIKYYHSDHTGFTGSQRDIPRSIIGLDHTNVAEFIRACVREDDTSDFQGLLMHQLQRQLSALRDYADRRHGESKIRKKYTQAADEISRVIEESNLSLQQYPDQISDNITDFINSLR